MGQVDSDRRVAAQIPGHLSRLPDGGFQDLPFVRPLQGKVLEDEEPELVAGFVEAPLRHVDVNPDGVHAGPAHQRGIRAQPLLRGPGRVHVRGQVVDPPHEDALAVEIDLPVAQLHGTRAAAHRLLFLTAAYFHLVQRLLSPVPGPPATDLRQVETYVEAVGARLHPHLALEPGARSFES